MPDSTPEYTATITGCLTQYLKSGSELGQFAKSPGLRETVKNIEETSGSNTTYLVVEEKGPISGCRMDQGECWPDPDNGKDSVVIFKAIDGAWPEFSEKVDRDTVLPAAVRTLTKKNHPIEVHAESVCYITDQGEPAHPISIEVNLAYGAPRAIPLAGSKIPYGNATQRSTMEKPDESPQRNRSLGDSKSRIQEGSRSAPLRDRSCRLHFKHLTNAIRELIAEQGEHHSKQKQHIKSGQTKMARCATAIGSENRTGVAIHR